MFGKIEISPAPVKRQLVIFINLPQVSNKKLGTFLQHASERAKRLHVRCSAYHILVDEKDNVYTVDMSQTEARSYKGMPANEQIQARDRDVFLSNERITATFIKQLEKVEGYYDHLLIIGEMNQVEYRGTLEFQISGIRNLDGLADYITSLTKEHSAATVWQRVQICKSASFRLKYSDLSFAEAVTPLNRMCYTSAPCDWSIIGKNGSAIDFIARNDTYQAILPVLHKAVSSSYEHPQIKEALSKKHLECTSIQCIYPKKDTVSALFSPIAFFRTPPTSPSSSPELQAPRRARKERIPDMTFS